MRAIANLAVWLLIEISLIILEFLLYSDNGLLRAPTIIGGVLVAVVTVFFGMAVFETIKHRHDKEEW